MEQTREQQIPYGNDRQEMQGQERVGAKCEKLDRLKFLLGGPLGCA